ncbi:MFS family permease [Acetoanaerobium pronyense]|uniref:MFS family permease n=1 Tax=Acetoanaerobium pronyense TaxID=1482736 RepID=A0ABS4KKK7_9FIRM|nr:MFS transporter [Acetoanaerobium pronyense]MBP2028317.1 MFS family permease [Acetoanaerobium pronyense]
MDQGEKKGLGKNINLYLTANLLISFAYGIFMMFAALYLKEVGYGENFVGKMLSSHTLSTAIFSVFGAYLVGRIGKKKSILIGIFGLFFGMLLMVKVDSSYLIIMMGILSGFGYAIKNTVEAMFLTENAPIESRVLAFSMNFTAMNLGMTSSNLMGGFISDFLSNYLGSVGALSAVLSMGGFIVLIAAIPVLMLHENKIIHRRTVSEYLLGYKNILISSKSANRFLLFNGTIGMGAGMVVPFFSVYLKYSLNVDDSIVGSILSFSQFGCVLGGLLIPVLVGKIGAHRAIVLCQLLSIPFLISIAFPQGILLIAISFFMRSSLMNMAFPLIQNIGMEMVHPLDRANLSSLMSLSGNLTRALGISVGGFIMENYSYNMPYYFTVGLYLIATSMFVFMFKGEVLRKESPTYGAS